MDPDALARCHMMRTLLYVRDHPGLSQSAIEKAVSGASNSVTVRKRLAELEAMGLVAYTTAVHGRRRYSVTGEGREIADIIGRMAGE